MRKLLLLPIVLVLLVSMVSAAGLIVKDLSIYQDEDRQRSMRDGDTYDEFIEPGEKIEFEIELENNLKDTDIEDIEITIKIDNIEKGRNISEKEDKFDLNEDKKKIKSIKIEIPDDADETKKRADITIRGVDENNTVHRIEWAVYLKIEDEDHDITVRNTKLNIESVECNLTGELIVWIENDGNLDEEEVVLEVENKELGIYRKFGNIDVEEEELYTKLVPLNVENISRTGKYPIEIRTYYKNIHLDDIETDDVDLEACKKQISIKKERRSKY